MSKKNKNKKLSLTSIVTGLVFFLVLVQLVISHSLASWGGRLRQLEQQARDLERQNLALTEEINRSTSLARLVEEAEELGMVKAQKILHFTPLPVALGK